MFGDNDGHDTINDFTVGSDQLQFSGLQSPDQLQLIHLGGNTIVIYGNTSVTLQGVNLSAEEVWASTQHD